MTDALQRCGLAIACALILAGPVNAGPYDHGEVLTITGSVTGPEGEPIAGVEVVLEAARRGFSFRQRGMVTHYRTQRSAVSDERGQFSIEWRWDDYYNELSVAATVPAPADGTADDEGRFEVLARADLSRRILRGSPVVVALSVEDVAPLERYRRFQASLESDDQQRIFSDLGRPDEVKSGVYAGHEEVSWWYFQRGRVFRFRDGALVESASFDPVHPF